VQVNAGTYANVQLTQVVGAPVNTITYDGGLYEAVDYTDVIYEVSHAGFVLVFSSAVITRYTRVSCVGYGSNNLHDLFGSC
jgi:hypothetical protein